MKIGLVGLPLAGKSTLFSALTGLAADAAAAAKGQEQVAVVKIPDERLDRLAAIFNPRKKTPAAVEFTDFSGLVLGEAKKQGFSEQFLGKLRTVDALLGVVRGFTDPAVSHPLKSVNPVRDLGSAEAELLLSDLAIIENRIEKLVKQVAVKKSDRDARELAVLEKCKEQLDEETPLRFAEFKADEEILIRGYRFLTLKPLIVAVNIDEHVIGHEAEALKPFEPWIRQASSAVIAISAKLEKEIQEFSKEEANRLLKDFGIEHSARAKLVATAYKLMGLASFFTVGGDEVKAWTVRSGTRAQQAAGAIHSDLERGFIRAEIVSYDDFIERKSFPECRTAGTLRLEGKDYPVRDGDIINFRFAV